VSKVGITHQSMKVEIWTVSGVMVCVVDCPDYFKIGLFV